MWEANDDPAYIAVRERIRAAILNGEYAPRQRLIEADVCEQLGASRLLVHAALQDLASQRLVEFQRYKGARVRAVSLEEAIEVTEIRILLEGFIAARATERVTTAQARQLRQMAADMRCAVEAGDLARYSVLNTKLHATLWEVAAQRIGAGLLEQLRGLTVRQQSMLSLAAGRSAVSLRQHEAIVAAVTDGMPAAAEKAMCAHLKSVAEALTELSRRAEASPNELHGHHVWT
jgi:DNA-binding GntR family transcriptional regulator